MYQCNSCKKRFTVEGEPLHYNHKGNVSTRKQLCHYCREHIDPNNDTERTIGVHLDCFVKQYKKWNLSQCWQSAQDWFAELQEW